MPPTAEQPHNRPMPHRTVLPSAHLSRRHAREQDGQALIIVGLAIVVVLIGLALGAEWGYGLTQRRVMQNAADGGALAGAKALASSVVSTGAGIGFRLHKEDVYCEARAVALGNRSFLPTGELQAITVWGSTDRTTWTLFPPPGTCPAPGNLVTSTNVVDPATAFIRVSAEVTYRGLFGAATGQTSLTAGATATARITGAAVARDGFTWPTMRHFNAADFQVPCATPCDPTTASPVVFWSATGSQQDIVFGNFKGLIDLSRYSPNINRSGPPADRDNCTNVPDAGCVPQLMKEWDRSSSVAPFKANLAGGNNACTPPAPAGKWFSGGNENDQQYEKSCSIANWAAYSFSGSQGAGDSFGNGRISLDTNWYKTPAQGGDLQRPFQESPDNSFRTNARSACAALAADPRLAALPAPSCPNTPSNAEKGDWVETASSGDLGANAAAAMTAFIDAHPLYDSFQHVKSGPGNAPEYGPHQVVNVYLWDCAESFDQSSPPLAQWSLALPNSGTDCSNIHQGNDTAATIDRVHVLTVVPFTFYRGLIDGSRIQGFWGGQVVADAGICRTTPTAPGCTINPFANSVFLVSDD